VTKRSGEEGSVWLTPPLGGIISSPKPEGDILYSKMKDFCNDGDNWQLSKINAQKL